MAREITQRELCSESGEIMRRLDPVGGLAPLRRRRFVRAEAAVETFRGAPSLDLGRLRSDLDCLASQDLVPRG